MLVRAALLLAWQPSTAHTQPTGQWVPIDDNTGDLSADVNDDEINIADVNAAFGKLGHSFL